MWPIWAEKAEKLVEAQTAWADYVDLNQSFSYEDFVFGLPPWVAKPRHMRARASLEEAYDKVTSDLKGWQ